VNEVCDEDRFTKTISDGLNEVRNGVQDGLFTAHHGEHNWEVAHRVLVPAFGPLTIRDMFDGKKITRASPNSHVNPVDRHVRYCGSARDEMGQGGAQCVY
jgi:hypothetical protein